MQHSESETEKYGHAFMNFWHEYCVNNCPTEGYDDAIEAAFNAWNYHEAERVKLESETNKPAFNIHVNELEAALDYAAENKTVTVRLEADHSSGIGAIMTVSKLHNKDPKNITDVSCW